MITKYYSVSVQKKKNKEDNIFHDFINYSKAVIIEFIEGEPGVFCYYMKEDEITPWHRVYTSEVKNVREEELCLTSLPPKMQHNVIVETENSIYYFTEI